MKIVCWNVQGARKSQLRLEVGFINRIIKPDILILLETMVNEQDANLIITNLGFSHYDTIPTENHCGGIWCLWNPINVDVSILVKESRAIHCQIKDNVKNKQCLLTAVYALAQERHKDAFWQHLKQLNEFVNLPWCIMRDLTKYSTHQKRYEVPL